MEKIIKKVNHGRKRKINLDNWNDFKRKQLKDSGKEYVTRKGIVVPKKSVPETVST